MSNIILPKDIDAFLSNIGFDIERPIKIVYEGEVKFEEDEEDSEIIEEHKW